MKNVSSTAVEDKRKDERWIGPTMSTIPTMAGCAGCATSPSLPCPSLDVVKLQGWTQAIWGFKRRRQAYKEQSTRQHETMPNVNRIGTSIRFSLTLLLLIVFSTVAQSFPLPTTVLGLRLPAMIHRCSHIALATNDHSKCIHLTRFMTSSPRQEEDQPETEHAAVLPISKGVAVLLTVPFAWGTFEIAVRSVYASEPALPALLFSVAYYSVAAVALLLSAWAVPKLLDNLVDHKTDLYGSSNGTAKQKNYFDDGEQGWPVVGGMELGTYLFVGNLLQVLGLQTVAADRAAFLLQLTTIFVPLAQWALFDPSSKIPPRTWLACLIALIGVGVMGLDHPNNGTAIDLFALGNLSELLHWSTGDSFIVLAAVAYTFHCLRLEVVAKSCNAVRLGTCKAITELAWSTFSVVVVLSLALYTTTTNDKALTPLVNSGQACMTYLRSLGHDDGAVMTATAAIAVVWTGLIPVAYTIVAQSYGQGRGGVRPVTANLIYTIQPICTAAFAYLILHEQLGWAGYAGGAFIGSAVLLVVAPSSSIVAATNDKSA